MIVYLKKTKTELVTFKNFSITHILRGENSIVDALAKLASLLESKAPDCIPVKFVPALSITPTNQVVMYIVLQQNWMTPILGYLKEGIVPHNKEEARALRTKAFRFTLIGEALYRKGFGSPLMRCVNNNEANYIIHEIHEDICDNHSARESLANKIVKQGYYWPTILSDSTGFVRKCDKCQRLANIPRAPPQQLTTMSSP